MALWKESSPIPSPPPTVPTGVNVPREAPVREPERLNGAAAVAAAPSVQKTPRVEQRESVIASDLSIEGKIEGAGHVRIAGKFKGDVRVDGNLTIDQGAQLTGQVSAAVVTVAGELQGNIIQAKRVELLDSGIIAGDVKAGSLTVAAGSRMRGQVEFGWEDKGSGSRS
ncbi:MAG: polymer-forming cytoskeletal protein [Proteobacteria bacterium]|nr:polymer-forming cytoskeletal protein [Pseudomonadota bacterium]